MATCRSVLRLAARSGVRVGRRGFLEVTRQPDRYARRQMPSGQDCRAESAAMVPQLVTCQWSI